MAIGHFVWHDISHLFAHQLKAAFLPMILVSKSNDLYPQNGASSKACVSTTEIGT